MAIARALKLVRPDTSFGPFRFLEAVPWLLLALACRVAGAAGTWLTLLTLIAECIAILMAFNAVARRAFELFDRPSPLERMSLAQEFRLSLRILWRVAVVLVAVAVVAACLGLSSAPPYLLLGLDGMAFNQPGLFGRACAAPVAALVLLFVLGADRETGKPTFKSAFHGLAEHGFRFAVMVAVVGTFHVVWGAVQVMLLNAVWSIPVFGGADQHTKNLIYFGVAFGFAFARLWVTLLILTYGLKLSCVGGNQAAAPSSTRP